MERRKFLIGTGALAAGGAAALGSGAFSRVESHRDVTIQVAEDPDAYLGLSGTGSANSDNYVDIDDNGHLEIDVGDSGNGGYGVNSNSYTWFDSMVQVCNQGKEDAAFWIVPPEDDDFPGDIEAEYEGEPRLTFYTGEAAGVGNDGISSIMGKENAVVIPLGECIELGLRTYTKGVNAKEEDQLFGDNVTLVADASVSGVPAEEAAEFTSVARMRRGALGGAQTFELAIKEGDFNTTGPEADVDSWEEGEEYAFEFSYDGEEYSLTVTDSDGNTNGSLTTDEVSAPVAGSQLRVNIRASDSAATVSNLAVNGTGFGGVSADDDNTPASSSPVVTFDTNDFTVTGDLVFDELGSSDETPAIDIQIEGFDA